MFTPQEVSEKVFPKSSGFGGGYQMAAVDQFLDSLTEDYTALFKENVTLKAKLKVLADKVEEYRATEESMRAALLTAQKMASKLVQEAQTEHDKLLANARADAKAEQERLAREQKDAEKRLALAKEETARFLQKSSELCRRQAEFLTQLPEIELPGEKPAPAKNEADSIGEDILRGFVDEMPAAQPELPEEPPRQEEPARQAPVTEDTIDMTKVFNLDELKFGRNYSGEE